MAAPTESRCRSLCIFAACVFFCGAYARLCTREFTAAHLAAQGTIAGLERAVRLSPLNAGYQDELGLTMLLDGDPVAAGTRIEHAIRLNPHDPQYWLDLATVRQSVGDYPAAVSAADQAVTVGGRSGYVLWNAGLACLANGAREKALRHFRHALELDAVPADRVVDVCWRATGDSRLIVNQLLPAKPEPYRALLSLLSSEERAIDADYVWQHLIHAAKEFPPDVSLAYIDFLLRQGRISDAAEAWHALKETNLTLQRHLTTDNCVENGGFEYSLLNGGFDWRYSSRPDAAVSVVSAEAHSGGRSLQVVFSADQITEAPIRQFVPVKPGTRYRFSAYAKTQDLRTVSGVHLRVCDAVGQREYVFTDELRGATDWTRLEATFTTSASTRLLAITVVRTPGNSSIHGNLWLDDVSIAEVP